MMETTVEQVKQRLHELEILFAANGGRGVELAEEIDALREWLEDAE